MNVSVVIPTRGDQDLTEIIESLAAFDEVLIWDNSKRDDLGVYGRYAMIEEARNEMIFTQDDDCVLAAEAITYMLDVALAPQPLTLLDLRAVYEQKAISRPRALIANMPERFREHYDDSCLVGFGAIFHRDLPLMAFGKFFGYGANGLMPSELMLRAITEQPEQFHRECDTVFTTLTPRILVDVPYTELPWASAPNRLWKQPDHGAQRKRMLDLARQVRDA